ncbi:MAG TPA: hypothetical protein VGR01_06080 [Burkholderiales bacterium]|nr:hypothetical protein [Burkholderiales bacterium]
MAFEALAKPVIDALMKALDRAKDAHLKDNARKAIAEAISELIRIHPDVGKAEARIAIAKAAGILDQDLFTAERMLRKVKRAAKKSAQPRRRKKPAARRVANRSQRKRGGRT